MNIVIHPEVEKFIRGLEDKTIAKTLRTIDLLEKFSHQLGIPHSKKVTDKLYELRVRGKQEIRIFYCFHQASIYLIHGFIKKSQKIPKNELRNAKNKYNLLT